nr:photosystem II protein L [Polygala tenuifolia]
MCLLFYSPIISSIKKIVEKKKKGILI